jgi:hypothetical protein
LTVVLKFDSGTFQRRLHHDHRLIVALDRLALDRFSSTFSADLGARGSGYRKRLRVILLMGYHRTHRVLFAMQMKDKYKFSRER